MSQSRATVVRVRDLVADRLEPRGIELKTADRQRGEDNQAGDDAERRGDADRWRVAVSIGGSDHQRRGEADCGSREGRAKMQKLPNSGAE
jgi:hypothetical protein